MGYEVRFVPTEEKMKEYKPWKEEKPQESLTDVCKFELLSYCMKRREETPSNIIKQIKFYLRYIANAAEAEEKTRAYFRWKENEDHILWYCGWEFSRDTAYNKDDIIDTTAERLFILADIVETPSYFDKHDQFDTKYNDILGDINEFIECAESLAIHNIIKDLDEFKEKDEEEC